MQPSGALWRSSKHEPYVAAGTLLTLVALVALWIWQVQSPSRALQEMRPNERRALYERTLATVRGSCLGPTGSELSQYCVDQAEFLGRFPECDDACAAIARRLAAPATR